jgi:hypothetical protein
MNRSIVEVVKNLFQFRYISQIDLRGKELAGIVAGRWA